VNTIELQKIAQCFESPFHVGNIDFERFDIKTLSIEEAYQVQQFVVEARVGRGERIVGYKVGCTSEAIRAQFGLTEPIMGHLMMPHIHQTGVTLDWGHYCQLAVEPEFVICIGRDVTDEIGPSESVGEIIDTVASGIELHHYQFRSPRPSIQELIASNGIHAGLILGEPKSVPENFDWNSKRLDLAKNGRSVVSGFGSSIMGGPMNSLRWLANTLLQRGRMLRSGDLVIPGSPVELVTVDRGDNLSVSVEGVASVHASFV
jgi:2-keto-4-pentenoate hydratase